MISHLDNDHVSGVKELLAQSKNGGIKVKNLVLPNLYIKDDEYMEAIYKLMDQERANGE